MWRFPKFLTRVVLLFNFVVFLIHSVIYFSEPISIWEWVWIRNCCSEQKGKVFWNKSIQDLPVGVKNIFLSWHTCFSFSCCMMGSWPPSLSSCIIPLPVMVSCVWSPHPRETSPTSSMYSMLWCQGWVSLSLSLLGSYDLKHKHSNILDFSNTKFFIFKNIFRKLLHTCLNYFNCTLFFI